MYDEKWSKFSFKSFFTFEHICNLYIHLFPISFTYEVHFLILEFSYGYSPTERFEIIENYIFENPRNMDRIIRAKECIFYSNICKVIFFLQFKKSFPFNIIPLYFF